MAKYKVSGNIVTSPGQDGSPTPDNPHPPSILLPKLMESGSLKVTPINCTQSLGILGVSW